METQTEQTNSTEILREFEHSLMLNKLNALSKISLMRPLSDEEFKQMKIQDKIIKK